MMGLGIAREKDRSYPAGLVQKLGKYSTTLYVYAVLHTAASENYARSHAQTNFTLI